MTVKNSTSLETLMSKRAATRIRTFCRDAAEALPDQVEKIVLFGSRARGESAANSDYDLAVFVKNNRDRRAVDHLLADIAYPHILDGIHISPVSVPSELMKSVKSNAFAQSLLRDGIEVA